VARKKNQLPKFALERFELPAEVRVDLEGAIEKEHTRLTRQIERERVRRERAREEAHVAKASPANKKAEWPPRPSDLTGFTHLQTFDPDAVQQLGRDVLHRVGEHEELGRTKKAVARMKEVGAWRRAALLPHDWRARLEGLEVSFPNFAAAIDYLRSSFAIAERQTPAIAGFQPLLLSGPPGVGKTLFVEEFANLFRLPLHRLDMASAQNGARLAGSDSFWSNTRPGLLFEILAYGDHDGVTNTIVLLDELDKVGGDRYDPIGALYTLLEPRSAKTFADHSFPSIALDASRILFVGTANNPERIPEPIRSRMRHVEITTRFRSSPSAVNACSSCRPAFRGGRTSGWASRLRMSTWSSASIICAASRPSFAFSRSSR
jgi:hypothetical protein